MCFSRFVKHSIGEENKMASMEAEDAANDGTDDDDFLDLTHFPVSDEEELEDGGEVLGK